MKDFFKNLTKLVSSPSHARTRTLLVVLLIVAAIPLTVTLSQRQQNLRQNAAGCIVRPACLDANPPCRIMQPADGWCAVSPSLGKLDWSTKYVSLKAEGASLMIDNKKYLVNINNLDLHSSPTYLRPEDGTYYTTLEAMWKENNVDMRMYMYFKYKPGGFWKLYDLRTYDGKANGDWLYFLPVDQFGQEIQNSIGDKYISENIYFSNNKEPAQGSILRFNKITLAAFLDLNPTPTSPTPSPKPSCMPRPACLNAKPPCQVAQPASGWCPTTTTPTPTSIACPQVVTPARNPYSRQCMNFASPCAVPKGWVKVASCGR